MSRASWMVRTCVAAAITLVFLACAKSNSSAPAVNSLGQHPADWVDTHWTAFNQNHASCTPCHGSYTVEADSGGTAQVSCFGCHHPSGPLHPAAWPDPAQHGAGAKAAPSLTGGFAHCAACHGTSYNTPLSVPGSRTYTCYTCHATAPHPAAPWHGTLADGTNHANTDPGNAAECAKCHANGANTSLTHYTTALAGTAPGCFNNTLCHGQNDGHIADWKLPANHGRLAAEAAPSAPGAAAPRGFAACIACHGANYDGVGATAPSCMTCHTQAPHPTANHWVSTDVSQPSHTHADVGNAAACAHCHTGGANSSLTPSPVVVGTPGCYNNTLCHDRSVINGAAN